MKQKTTQKTKLINYLNSGKKITSEQAFNKFGTKNLRAAIGVLREEGYEIDTVKVSKNSKTNAYVMR